MNHLEALKQKLVVKPTVQERERVIVQIRGETKKSESPPRKRSKSPPRKRSKSPPKKGDGDEDGEERKCKPDAQAQAPEPDAPKKPKTVMVDMTHVGFDRASLLTKLATNKKSVVRATQTQAPEQVPDIQPPAPEKKKRAKKLDARLPLIIEEDEGEEEIRIVAKPKRVNKKKEKVPVPVGEDDVPEVPAVPEGLEEVEVVKAPKPRKRKTDKLEKGVAVLGPEVNVVMGDTDLTQRLPKRDPPVNIKVGSYIMNNREVFVNFINSLFEPYKRELEETKESISCDNLGKSSGDFSLLTHQKIVRDYLNLYTPYRGLLLNHGLGSGKTCSSIAIAEGMKDSKNVIVMTPASLRANYIGELKKCGDLLYKKSQFWEWISVQEKPELAVTLSAVLNLPQEFIRKNGGAFFINVQKHSNYDELSDANRKVLEEQLNEMIQQKYQFINYNGLREKRLSEMTSNYRHNIFDNAVVIIDEAHNFISRIVNKLKKEKPIPENKRGEKERMPINLATKLYEMLLSATNARIILLSGTPIINYPNEFAIIFNILRGYIKTWRIPLNVQTTKKVDKKILSEMLLGEKTLDYLDYSPSSKILTITRNPFGFKNKIKRESGYHGVTNNHKNEAGKLELDNDVSSDDEFEKKIIGILRRYDIEVVASSIEIKYKKALPDKFDEFMARYVNENDRTLKNADALKRRILGLSSYFRSAQESLLPKFDKMPGVDYHIERIPMSDVQFKVYEAARKEERKMEKTNKKGAKSAEEDYEDKSSTYRIFSRLACNFAIPDRPLPIRAKKKGDEEGEEGDANDDASQGAMVNALKEGKKVEAKQDVQDEREGEIEGDEVLEALGGTNYKERLQAKLKDMSDHAADFFTPDALVNYSPKFLKLLENIQDEEHQGLHLIYSQFRTAEGIGLITQVLDHNGFTQFKIRKNARGVWVIDIPEAQQGNPTYALYTGTETVEEKEIVRKIYNGEWDDIPVSIGDVLKQSYTNNNMGEVIKVFMITSSGSEGINLRNTRYVHIVDPYWHPVRSEQVIGRARRICSHKDLPQALQTVEVFVYLMVFSEAQLKSDEAIELKRKDLSKAIPHVPLTSDQYLFEISEIKANLTNQLTTVIKESAFDCFLYSNGKCVNFGDPSIDKFSFVPDFADQQNDTTVQANKRAIEWTGKPVTIHGVEYVYRRINANVLNIYDKKSYEAALQDSSIMPLQVGTLEKNEKGQQVFKALVVR